MAKRINETPILRGEDARRFEELARTAHLRTVSPDIMKRMKENYERVNGEGQIEAMPVSLDPIVCVKVVGGYIVLAAWGDEGSDPQVFNAASN